MNKYVKYEYILFFNNISHKSCDYFLDLCYKNINQDDAYNILMSIPFIKKKNTLEEINYIRPEIINYNYKWCLALLSHNFPIQIIQNLLTHFFEYYYINIIYINMIIKNPYSSYVVMREFIPITQKYAQIYYQLKLRNIEALMAYDMATINNITRYIYELICYDYPKFVDMLVKYNINKKLSQLEQYRDLFFILYNNYLKTIKNVKETKEECDFID